jgi:hypothetical protein
MPFLPGRDPQDRGVVTLGSALAGLALPALVAGSVAVRGFSGVGIALLGAALIADSWASVVALAEAQRGAPRAVNRWDVAARALAAAATAFPALDLAFGGHGSFPSAARAVALMLVGGAVCAWLVRRADFRSRLSDLERGWPRDDRGRPRIPRRAYQLLGPKAAFWVLTWFVVLPVSLPEPEHVFLLVLFGSHTSECMAEARRATDLWWERRTVGFGKEDFLSLAIAFVGTVLGALGFVASLTPHVEYGQVVAAGATFAISVGLLVQLTHRWLERDTADDWLSVWD